MKKKILLITDQLRVGGGEKYFLKIENNINRENIELFSAAEDGECRDIIKNKKNLFILPTNKFKSTLYIKNIINDKGIDIIHANSLRVSMMSFVAKSLSKRNPKILYTKHNLTYLEIIHEKIFSIYANKFIDKLVTVCDLDKRQMVVKGVKENNVISIPNGADTDEFKFNSKYLNNDNKEINIGILARLSEVKNHRLFLEIIDSINKDNRIKNKINVFIAGDGELREEIESYINNKDLNVNMLGNVVDTEKFLSSIDILMLTSKREVFPMAILEALSVGAIVISNDVGGVSDVIINKKTGYLIKDSSIESFKKAVIKVIEDKNENIKIIKNGRIIIEKKYSNKIMMEKLERLYLES